MGYCIEVMENNFKFKKENEVNILNAIREYAKTKDRISWVDKNLLLTSNSVEEVFDEIRYPLILNDEGYYEIDYFSGEKLGDDDEIFKSIAKYIEDSYIEYLGEDGTQWRYIFKNGIFEEKTAKIIWN